MRKKNKLVNKTDNKVVNTFIIVGIIFLIASLVLMLNRNKKVDNHIIEISYQEYSEIINKDEYSIILLTSPTCSHCKNYKPYVNYICDDYNLVAYDLNITTLSYEEYLDIHDKYSVTKNHYNENGIPSLTTPTTIITKNGEEVDAIVNDIGYSGLLEFLKKNDVIK